MKILSTILLFALGLTATTASAAGLECTTDTPFIDFLTLDRDGGEETVTVHYLSEEKERFLVIQNNQGKVVAVHDNDLDGGYSARGVVLVIDEVTNKGHLALSGIIIPVHCHKK